MYTPKQANKAKQEQTENNNKKASVRCLIVGPCSLVSWNAWTVQGSQLSVKSQISVKNETAFLFIRFKNLQI